MSNETKQTTTMWLTMKLGDLEMLHYNGAMDVIEYLKAKTKVLEKAKEMEKEQELKAYANGQADTLLMFKQKISKMKDISTEFNQIISENFWDLV